ncbi:MAG: hypothetical protein ACPHK8_06630 [Thermoplasmatota archaeon]
MKEEANASLLEIVFAAIILLGSMGLVATMEPPIQALEPTTSDDGYLDSVMDAFLLSGGDAEALVQDLWVDGESDGDAGPGSPVGTDWFNATVGAGYSIYLSTGYADILLYGTGLPGAEAMMPFVVHATEPGLLSGSPDMFVPGEVRYFDDVLGDLVPVLGSSQEVVGVTHMEPVFIFPDYLSLPSEYSRSPDGREWVDVWDDSIQEGTIPVAIPYGLWEVEVRYRLLPILPYTYQTFDWLVVPSPQADSDVPQYPLYQLKLVVP